MIPTLPRSKLSRYATAAYVVAFFAFLFVPLVVVAVFAFNNANYPAPPWRGFTLDWFVGGGANARRGLFADAPLLKSVATSVLVAGWVTVLSVAVGTANAFLLERVEFRGKSALSLLMLAPLVIPGVILGISILAFASRLAQFADDAWGVELDFLRPGLPLVVAGQFSYIVSIATLTIAARLKRFDATLEEAAFNLGASRAAVLWTVTLPYLKPPQRRGDGAGEQDVIGAQPYDPIAHGDVDLGVRRRVGVAAQRDVSILARAGDPRDRRLHLGVVDPAGFAHAARQIEGADERGVEPGHVQNAFDVLHRLDMLDLDNERDLVVRALHVRCKFQIEALRRRDADAANSRRRILARAHRKLRVLGVIHQRHDYRSPRCPGLC